MKSSGTRVIHGQSAVSASKKRIELEFPGSSMPLKLRIRDTLHIYIYIYVCVYRERERERYIYIYISLNMVPYANGANTCSYAGRQVFIDRARDGLSTHLRLGGPLPPPCW